MKPDYVVSIANRINELGLTMPAVFLLEAHRPLAFLGSQVLLVAQPTLDIFLPRPWTDNTVELLSTPEYLDQLLAHLENPTEVN